MINGGWEHPKNKEIMYTIVLALHVFVCILLILAVLLQNSKDSDLGAALGGGSGSEMFGPKAPSSIMNKITTIIAAAFLVLSLILAIMSGLGNDSVMRKADVISQQGVPATTSSDEPLTINIPSSDNAEEGSGEATISLENLLGDTETGETATDDTNTSAEESTTDEVTPAENTQE